MLLLQNYENRICCKINLPQAQVCGRYKYEFNRLAGQNVSRQNPRAPSLAGIFSVNSAERLALRLAGQNVIFLCPGVSFSDIVTVLGFSNIRRLCSYYC